MENKFKNPLSNIEEQNRIVDPCVVVIFGATGDLTARKLLPSFYSLALQGKLPPQFACIGFARRDKTDDQFRKEMREAIIKHSKNHFDEKTWKGFSEKLFYLKSEFQDDEGYKKLKKQLLDIDYRFGTRGNRIFYLANQPSFFTVVCHKLCENGLIYNEKETEHWSRLIVEKPFGHDLKSGLELQKELSSCFTENQIYRIDHYLGKETVQNILVFRFANSIFEPLWNTKYIDHVQITIAESLGIENRAKFYEETGLVRDMMQNHVMQLISLVAMEPPKTLDPEQIHSEKVKVLNKIAHFSKKDIENNFVCGQYSKGFINGAEVPGYREEENINPESRQETFAALKLFIKNKRWSKVPFYIRVGKRLPKRVTEIAIIFKNLPQTLFEKAHRKTEQNVLSIRIQPDEGIALKINCKVPDTNNIIQPVKMDFRYGSYFGISTPDAYERLICDCILGDHTLFAKADEVLTSWKILDPILKYMETAPADFSNYRSGSWGPQKAMELMLKDGRKWRLV